MEINIEMMRIIYFGIYKPTAPRDKIYINGLKSHGVEFLECVDSSSGLRKYFILAKRLWRENGDANVIWVGYLSGRLIPLARIIAPHKKIVFNALNSMYESYILDRERYSKFNPVAWSIWLMDFLAFHLADVSLVESIEQKKFISKLFFVNPNKLEVVYTGADESVFYPDPATKKKEKFTVVFRGMFLPATGVEYVFEAAKILKDKDVNFIIIGWGRDRQAYVENIIKDNNLTNVEWIHWFLEPKELREKMLSAHVMLGQFSSHERMDRTIQNKTFEAMALGMPYITRDSKSNREILTDKVNCLFVKPDSAEDLANKILDFKNTEKIKEQMSHNATVLYQEKLKAERITEGLERIIY